jgi:hypothetical protein
MADPRLFVLPRPGGDYRRQWALGATGRLSPLFFSNES